MKTSKLLLTLLLVLLCTLSMVCPVLADAIDYDYMGIWIDGTQVPSYTVYIASTGININMREGPGESYVVLGTANNYAPVRINAEKDGWGYAEFQNPDTGRICTGWIALSHTLPELPVSAASKTVYAAPESSLRLRSGPASCYPSLLEDTIPVGVSLQIVEICYFDRCDHAWGRTVYEGLEGWVCLNETQDTDPFAAPEESPAVSESPVVSESPAVNDSPAASESPAAPSQSPAPSASPSAKPVTPSSPITANPSRSPSTLVIILIILALLLLAAVVVIVLLISRRKK